MQGGMRVRVGALEILARAAPGHERARPRQVVRQQSIVIREACGVAGVIAAAVGKSLRASIAAASAVSRAAGPALAAICGARQTLEARAPLELIARAQIGFRPEVAL